MNLVSTSRRVPPGFCQHIYNAEQAWKGIGQISIRNRHRRCFTGQLNINGSVGCHSLPLVPRDFRHVVNDLSVDARSFSTSVGDQGSRRGPHNQQRRKQRKNDGDGSSKFKFRRTNMQQGNRNPQEIEYLSRQTRELLKDARHWNNKYKNGANRGSMPQGLKNRMLNTIKKWSKLWKHKNFMLQTHMKDDIHEGARASYALLNEIFEEESRLVESKVKDDSDFFFDEVRTVCNHVIAGWSKCAHLDSGKNALSILSRMEYLHEQGLSRYAPDAHTYNSTLSALSATINAMKRDQDTRFVGAEVVSQMEDLMEKMEELYATKKNVKARPNGISYNILMTACARSGSLDHPGERANRHFQKMRELYRLNPIERKDLRPQQETYGPLLLAWTQRNNLKDMEHAERIIRDMEAEAEQRGDPSMRPNNILLSNLLIAYCRVCDENGGRDEESAIAVKRALSVFEWMVSSYLNGNEEVKPAIYVINRLIQSTIKCRHKTNETGAIEEAEKFLDRVETLYRDGTGIGPDVYTYTIVTSTWARSKAKDAAFRAEMILNRMQRLYSEGANHARPNTTTYNTVISAYARHGTTTSAAKAESLLQRMDELVEDGNDDVRPDKISFSSVMTAYMNSGLADTSYQVEKLHMEMERRYLEEGQESCKPDTISFSTVLSCLGKSTDFDAPLRAEAVVKRMEGMGYNEVAPSIWSYNHVLQCWVHSRLPDAMKKAEATVEVIKKKFGRLDHFSYCHLLQGWSMRFNEPGAAERANTILDNFIDMYIADRHSIDQRSVRETTIFNIVIMLHSRAGNVEGAMTVLQRMIELSQMKDRNFPSPTIDTYNSVFSAISRARTSGGDTATKERLLELTLSLLREIHLDEHLQPDGSTYGELFRICSNTIVDDEVRDHSLEDLFHRSCEAGYINAALMRQIQTSFSSDMYERLIGPFVDSKFGDRTVNWGLIPYEWKCAGKQTSKYLKVMDEKWLPNASRYQD